MREVDGDLLVSDDDAEATLLNEPKQERSAGLDGIKANVVQALPARCAQQETRTNLLGMKAEFRAYQMLDSLKMEFVVTKSLVAACFSAYTRLSVLQPPAIGYHFIVAYHGLAAASIDRNNIRVINLKNRQAMLKRRAKEICSYPMGTAVSSYSRLIFFNRMRLETARQNSRENAERASPLRINVLPVPRSTDSKTARASKLRTRKKARKLGQEAE